MMSPNKPLIAYYRVSTEKQGKDGLGMGAQKQAVEKLAEQNGARIVASYTEVESGKRADRPQLTKAIAHAKRSKATLVIAKLDRLSRNAAFLFALQDAGIDFVCADNPNTNRLTVRLLAVIAQDERERISQRTKDALAEAKRRGVKLGGSRPECRNLTEEGRKRGIKRAGEVSKENADAAYSDLYATIRELRDQGRTQQQIAEYLNQEGHTTRRGKPWNQVQVMRVLRRMESCQ